MLRSARVVAVLVAATMCGPAAAAGPARTPPSTWSTAGYQQLRFGMGPGDVEDALKKGDGPLYLDKALELETPMPGIALGAPTGSRVNVSGRGTTAVVFAFWKDQLYLVALVFTEVTRIPGIRSGSRRCRACSPRSTAPRRAAARRSAPGRRAT